MNRNLVPLIFLLAIILIIGGCGSSNPIDSSMRGEGALDTIGAAVEGDMSDMAGMHPWDRYTGEDVRNLPQYIEGEVLIVLHDGVDPQALYQALMGDCISYEHRHR